VLERLGPEPNALMVLAGVHADTGDLETAIDLYERARALMPTHVHVLVNLASAYRAAGRLQEARRTLDAALQVDGRFAIAHNNLGNVLSDLGERREARRSYERAAALDPLYSDPVSGLASIAEEEHRLDDARGLAERALQLAPQNVLAALTLARVELRQDDALGASAVLEALLRGGALSMTNRIVTHGALGEAYDQLARYDEAFTQFAEANALQHGLYAATFAQQRGALAPASIARLTAFVEMTEVSAWRPAPPSAATPVFLVGFPRSGTTLLDQILASHPEVTTLEERDTLTDAASELLDAPALQRWADLADDEIERLRGLYWQRVRAGLSSMPRTPVFVDKQPLNAVLLPLIHRLFPAAKILLALRDPRDVVLSCYQQRFGMNAGMFELLRLDSATAYYDAVMRLVEVSRRRLPLSLYAVKYEDVVASFEATTRGVLAFLELAWDENVYRYAATASKRSISTPSAAQVVRPLYGSARGRWRNYRQFLEPYLPMLAPWLKTFGYEA
jgi:tetratricopeptide (TPR) repeat protein